MIHPPSQKATGVNPWMNAKRVTLRSLGEGGYASAGFAKAGEDAMAVKAWSFTVRIYDGLLIRPVFCNFTCLPVV